jgi:hypothetical protein
VQIKVQVIAEQREAFEWRRGKGVHHVLLCVDCDSETPLGNLFDYIMTPEEAEEYFGRLRERIVQLGITQLVATFGGRFRAKGKMAVLSPLKPVERKK